MHLQFCEGVPLTLQTTCMEPLRKFRQRIFTQQRLTYFNFCRTQIIVEFKNAFKASTKAQKNQKTGPSQQNTRYSKFPSTALFQPQMMWNSWDGQHFCHWSNPKEHKHEEAIIANGNYACISKVNFNSTWMTLMTWAELLALSYSQLILLAIPSYHV